MLIGINVVDDVDVVIVGCGRLKKWWGCSIGAGGNPSCDGGCCFVPLGSMKTVPPFPQI